MGAGIVLFFWLILVGLYGGAVLILCAIWVFAWRRQRKILKWLAGLSAAVMIIAAILVVALYGYAFIESSNPATVFRNSFGEPPSEVVSEIQSDLYWFADTGSVFLRFETTEEEFLRLVPEGLTRRTLTEIQNGLPGGSGIETPEWWKFRFEEDWAYFWRNDFNLKSPGRRGFFSETEYYAYNPNDGLAYFRFLGID